MQQIEYKESPSPHVVVKNFLPSPAARECLAEAQWLEPVYQEATVMGEWGGKYDDGCEECVAYRNTYRKGIRQNKVVYLDDHYNNTTSERQRYQSKLLGHLETALTQKNIQSEFNRLPHLFPLISKTTHMETILSSYGKCDFYGWHVDGIPNSPASRMITCVLHFNTEPQQYEGGELILTGDSLSDNLPYSPEHNTAIFFDSHKTVHAVDETTFDGDFKDSRFSINLWLGFSSKREEGDTEFNFSHKYR